MIKSGYDPKGPIFISYRQSDGRPFAEALDIYLRAGGLVPWRDLVDLSPGETAQRVTEAFEEGISNAVLIVTPQLKDSHFVPDIELPKLMEYDADTAMAKPFHVLVLNTIASDEFSAEIDVEAPDRILEDSGRWPPRCDRCARHKGWKLRNLKQYAYLPGWKEARQLYADLLDARLMARVGHLADKEVSIQTQTRPEGNARSRLSGTNRSGFIRKDPDDPYDLIVRLRQDPDTGVPSEQSLRALQETLPLLVDGLYGHGVERVLLDGSGHAVLLWAIGAALPITRIRRGSLVVEDIHQKRWSDSLPVSRTDDRDESAPCDCSSDTGRRLGVAERVDREYFVANFTPALPKLFAMDVPQNRVTRAAVLLEFSKNANHKAFNQLTERLKLDLPPIKVRIEWPDSPGATEIPAGEGPRLVRDIMKGLREIVHHTGVDEIHVASNLPSALAALLGRNSNTLNLVLHELGRKEVGGHREYFPVVRLEAGMPGGPIMEVFPQSHTRRAR